MKHHFQQNKKQKFYLWDWAGGGYNTAWAESLEEATQIATEMGDGVGVKLRPVNVRESYQEENDRYNRAHSMD